MAQITPDETILGLLAARPQHGYDLMETFRDPTRLGQVWNLSTSQLYAVLKRLEAQGLIAGCEVICANAPPRTDYTLSEAGRERLHTWLYAVTPSASIRRVRVEFLSRLYTAHLLKLPIKPIVEVQRQVCQRKQAELTVTMNIQKTNPDVGTLAQDLVIAQLTAILHWLDSCESRIKNNHEN